MAFRNCKLNTNQKGLLKLDPPLLSTGAGLGQMPYRSLAWTHREPLLSPFQALLSPVSKWL